MEYAMDVTINLTNGEKKEHRVERGAWGVGIAMDDLLEKNPKATSLVVTVGPKPE